MIRDGEDFARHVEYIHYNPVKHGYVGAPIEWEHSSFHRYVRNGLISGARGAHGMTPRALETTRE